MVFKTKSERVAIFIDGSNFYGYLKDSEIGFTKGMIFDYGAFASYLIGAKRKCISKRYFTGVFSNFDNSSKSNSLVRGQQKFFQKLSNQDYIIKRGRIIKTDVFREKGTDVKIAIDLVVGAIDNLYDTAILVSSDTDLIPAVKYLKFKGKKLEYVGFSHAPSLGMQKHANLSRLLLREDIDKFIQKKQS